MSDVNYQNLAHHVVSRRSELKLSRDEAARQADMSNDTWKKVERGETVRESTYARIEKILGWAPGECHKFLDSVEPTEDDGPPPGSAARLPEEDLYQGLVSSMVAVTDNLTAAEIREISQRTVEEAKRRGLL